MAHQSANARLDQSQTALPITHTRPDQDISGYTVFSSGDVGAAHVMAHRMLDENRIELGHQHLGEWFQDRSGAGSDWIHLHFHMAIFELAMNDWDAAYARFLNEILPAAATTEEALTDAPALLWRLALTTDEPVVLPWDALRNTALGSMQRPGESFTELHNLLSLAGAGDLAGIDQWLRTRPAKVPTLRERLVEKMAVALRAYATGLYTHAANLLQRIVPQLSQVGGSRAQNQLFRQLQERCWDKAGNAPLTPLYAKAA
jgi:hypothetical protein